MGLWAQIKQLLPVQLLVGYVFVMSGLIICLLMLLTYALVWPFSKDWYRRICHHLAYMHWCEMTFLGQWWSNSELTLVVENEDVSNYISKESAIVVANHKYEIDWLMCWCIAERLKILGGSKIYGKSSLKYAPLIGWQWVMMECIFLRREWNSDKETLRKDLSHLVEYPPNYWVILLLYCEGTRFTEAKHKESMAIARKKGIPELKHHLLPRSKGFVLSMQGIKGKIPAIYDMTVGFRETGAEPTLMNIINGRAVHCEIYFRRIKTADVPIETDEACADWLQQLYREKDVIYDDFDKNGTFTKGIRKNIPCRKYDLIISIMWAILLWVPLFHYSYIIFISGSIYMKIGFFVLIAAISVVMRLVISLTEIKKGSAYGSKFGDENKSS